MNGKRPAAKAGLFIFNQKPLKLIAFKNLKRSI
jgi:hypothetical protein